MRKKQSQQKKNHRNINLIKMAQLNNQKAKDEDENIYRI